MILKIIKLSGEIIYKYGIFQKTLSGVLLLSVLTDFIVKQSLAVFDDIVCMQNYIVKLVADFINVNVVFLCKSLSGLVSISFT